LVIILAVQLKSDKSREPSAEDYLKLKTQIDVRLFYLYLVVKDHCFQRYKFKT